MYAAQLHDIVHQYGVQLHSFADDSQLVRLTYVRDIAVAKQDVVQCIADIEAVSSSFRLKLNADKSEVIWLGTRQQLSQDLHIRERSPATGRRTLFNIVCQKPWCLS